MTKLNRTIKIIRYPGSLLGTLPLSVTTSQCHNSTLLAL